MGYRLQADPYSAGFELVTVGSDSRLLGKQRDRHDSGCTRSNRGLILPFGTAVQEAPIGACVLNALVHPV